MSAALEDASPAALLPAGLAAQVEAATGAQLETVRLRGAGGASREGAELSLRYPDGRLVKAFMNYDVARGGVGDDAAFLAEAAILRELSGPLADQGVRVGRFIAAIPESRALITTFVEGEADLNRLKTEQERRQVAASFMAQLARLHAIDATGHPIPEMGEPRPPSQVLPERLAAMRRRAAPGDALVALCVDWLEANIPPDPERVVIVHGDAGPANFLYRGDEVVALFDWELVHYGDPMADFAMINLRMVFQPFMAMPEAFDAYRAAGGAEIDLDRVRFYRLFLTTFLQSGRRLLDPSAPRPPNLGMNLVYWTMQRRALAEALAEAAGVELPTCKLPDAPPKLHDLSFDVALDDLRETIGPAISVPRASVKAKGLARLVKWWRAHERYGPALEREELAELKAALGRTFADVAEGRGALAAAVAARAIEPAVAIRLVNGQAARAALLMADAAGALAGSRFPPLA